MTYEKSVILKDGRELVLKSGTAQDGETVYEVFIRTHEETDYLLTYPDENTFDTIQEAEFLESKLKSENEVEILAFLEGKLVGIAGVDRVGDKYKLSYRAEYGISILKEFWGLGIGKAMTKACIECAKEAGYSQLELTVVAENKAALSLYEALGFVEFGRNPRGFLSRISGYQETVNMRMEF